MAARVLELLLLLLVDDDVDVILVLVAVLVSVVVAVLCALQSVHVFWVFDLSSVHSLKQRRIMEIYMTSTKADDDEQEDDLKDDDALMRMELHYKNPLSPYVVMVSIDWKTISVTGSLMTMTICMFGLVRCLCRGSWIIAVDKRHY